LGITQVGDLIAVTDGGNGLEEALQRHLADNLMTILDWYHAAEHLCHQGHDDSDRGPSSDGGERGDDAD
jgi:hypothetical protein